MPVVQPDFLQYMEDLSRMASAKWKPAILLSLVFDGKQRFSELKRAIPGITQRMLAERLRELEADGLVTRTTHADMPVRVEYEITGRGAALQPVFKALHDWASSGS